MIQHTICNVTDKYMSLTNEATKYQSFCNMMKTTVMHLELQNIISYRYTFELLGLFFSCCDP